MTLESNQLYSAKQAGRICGFEPAELQNILDRGYAEATVVPQGNRTYRMFTRDQLVWLCLFGRLTDAFKPSVAQQLVEITQELFTKLHFEHPVEFIVYEKAVPNAIYMPQFLGGAFTPDQFRKAMGGGAFVVDYKSCTEQVDQMLRFADHFDK